MLELGQNPKDFPTVLQALGDIAFAYSFSFILIEITVRPPTMLPFPSCECESTCMACTCIPTSMLAHGMHLE